MYFSRERRATCPLREAGVLPLRVPFPRERREPCTCGLIGYLALAGVFPLLAPFSCGRREPCTCGLIGRLALGKEGAFPFMARHRRAESK